MLKDLKKGDRIHCIGIGGIGVSGLAQLLHEEGFKISGSDLEEWDMISQMREKGIDIKIGHIADNLPDDCKLVIYSSAIPENNVEIEKANEFGISTIRYSEAIKQFIDKNDLKVIAVCGTHGKTTTTAFASLALMNGADMNPTVLIGSAMKELENSNYKLGDKEGYFIIEACEYKRNFLQYSPDIVILTNLEAEHLDYFKDEEDYKSAFKEFIHKLPPDGHIIANMDDDNVMDVVNSCDNVSKILFSSKNAKADWYFDGNTVMHDGEIIGEMSLSIPGEFNKMNAIAGLILRSLLNVPVAIALEDINDFKGTWRRFEQLGNFNGMRVISDYAHHPTAIRKTLKATHEKYSDQKICVIFQPHQYNRTKHFISEFANSFADATCVIIPDIYEVRDTQEDTNAISVDGLIEELRKHKKDSQILKITEYDKIKQFLIEEKDEIDIIMVMGAGDIWKLAQYHLIN